MTDLDTITITWDEQDRPLITIKYASSDGASENADPDAWLAALGADVPDHSAEKLRKLLEINQQRGFVSLADLAAEMGIEKKEADSWNRTLGKSIKKIVRAQGFLRIEQEDGTAQLFDYKWDESNNQWLYEVPAKFRPALSDALDSR